MKKIKITLNFDQLFAQAWKIYKKNWFNFIIIGIIFSVVSSLGNLGIQIDFETGEIVGNNFGLFKTLSWLLSVYLGVGYIRYLLKLVDGKKVKIKDIFYGIDSITHFIYVIVVIFVVKLITLVGLLFFIIPGIIASVGLMFAKYIIAENKGGDVEIVDAIKGSWNITKGHKWQLLWLMIVLGIFNVLGVIALLVGLVITIPMTALITTIVYRKLSQNNTQKEILLEEE